MPKLREYKAIDLKFFFFVTVTMMDARLLAKETHEFKEKKIKMRNSFHCFIEEQAVWTGLALHVTSAL